jgi:integrase
MASQLATAARGGFKHSLVPLLALGAFAGIRTGEILRLRWEDIGPKWINVQSKRTRTASRRLVPVLPALKPWLALRRRSAGPVCPYRRVELALARLARSARLKWKRNGLRHSFITYRVAQVQNVAQVALECGNSPAMIFQHYRELVTPQQAAEWFKICPKSVPKISSKITNPL